MNQSEDPAQETQPEQSNGYASMSDFGIIAWFMAAGMAILGIWMLIVRIICEETGITASENRLSPESIIRYIFMTFTLFCIGLSSRRKKE